jgi:hypothetical protein
MIQKEKILHILHHFEENFYIKHFLIYYQHIAFENCQKFKYHLSKNFKVMHHW